MIWLETRVDHPREATLFFILNIFALILTAQKQNRRLENRMQYGWCGMPLVP